MNDHYLTLWLRKSISLLIFLAACAVEGRAQVEPSLPYVVNGIVKDASTGRALKSVNISIPGSHISTVTNDEGAFSIKAKERPKQLRFSHIGYKTIKLATPSDGKEMSVKLAPNTVVLNDVVVMMGDPERIVRIAISKIPDNYSLTAEQDRCFYRETAQKRKKFIYIAEAVRVLSIFLGEGRVSLLSMLSTRDSSAQYSAARGMDMPVQIGDRPQYVVSISPKYHTDYALYYGQLYIDKETLSFTRISLQLDMSDRENATRAMLVRKPLGVKFRPKELSLLINYTYDEGVTRLSYLSTVFRFNCDWKKRLLATSFTAINEMVVTDRCLSGFTPIRRKDSFSEHESLFDQQTNFSDDNFWKDYNIIEPTESLEKAIHRIVKAK